MARNIHAETDLDLELREDRVAKRGDRNDDEVLVRISSLQKLRRL